MANTLSTEQTPLLTFLEVKRIKLDDIRANQLNPRDDIASKEVEDLKASILEVGGVLVPVVVYREGDHYVLLDGERRWRASKELAKSDERFTTIPANIIAKPPSTKDNLMTMFNIHYKRKGWSTAALAEAIGKLDRIYGEGKLSSSDIERLTGVTGQQVNDCRIFMRMPDNIRKRCITGQLDEFYPILLGRNLINLQDTYPELMSHYNWDQLIQAFIKKVDAGYMRSSKSFQDIGRMAKLTIENGEEKLFERTFDRLVRKDDYTPAVALAAVELQISPKREEGLRKECLEFMGFLDSYAKKGARINESTKNVLRKLVRKIEALIGSN